jgi:hypothetical protein
MRTLIPLKFISGLLMLLLLSVTIGGVHGTAHAQTQAAGADVHESAADGATTHHCPCSPLEQHTDDDGCDCCVNCACHAPLTIRPFQLSYSPLVQDLDPAEPFSHLPEVYLPKFIPPQILS